MDWIQVITIIGANLAIIIPMFLWIRSEANDDRRMFYDLLQGMKDDMKDFHGKLEKQDAEFKSHMGYFHK
jgi:hypothetical protein